MQYKPKRKFRMDKEAKKKAQVLLNWFWTSLLDEEEILMAQYLCKKAGIEYQSEMRDEWIGAGLDTCDTDELEACRSKWFGQFPIELQVRAIRHFMRNSLKPEYFFDTSEFPKAWVAIWLVGHWLCGSEQWREGGCTANWPEFIEFVKPDLEEIVSDFDKLAKIK